MTKAEKRKFVRSLMNRMRDELLERSDRWPEEWDGHELRALIEEIAMSSNSGQCSSPYGNKCYPGRRPDASDKRRRRAFENECATRNLP